MGVACQSRLLIFLPMVFSLLYPSAFAAAQLAVVGMVILVGAGLLHTTPVFRYRRHGGVAWPAGTPTQFRLYPSTLQREKFTDFPEEVLCQDLRIHTRHRWQCIGLFCVPASTQTLDHLVFACL